MVLVICAQFQVVEGMATPVDLNNEDALLKAAATSLNSKVVSQHSTILAPIAVQAIRAGLLLCVIYSMIYLYLKYVFNELVKFKDTVWLTE